MSIGVVTKFNCIKCRTRFVQEYITFSDRTVNHYHSHCSLVMDEEHSVRFVKYIQITNCKLVKTLQASCDLDSLGLLTFS